MIYCTNCKVEVDARVEERLETIEVRGEKVDVESRVAVCPMCKEILVDEDLESRNLDLAYETYRTRHHLLSPTEIAEIRQEYGLSQRSLARLLGWGEITIHRYESGAIQDNAHEIVLRLIAEPQNLKRILEKNPEALSLDAAKQLNERIDSMLAHTELGRFEILLEKLCSSGPPSEANGFREFDNERMEEAILFLVSRVENAFKTKLNKLLWYADFLSYRDSSRSITGSAYVAAIHGPVPKHYDLLLGAIAQKGLIRASEVEFPSGSCGERIEACREPNMSLFSGTEQGFMDRVVQEFRSSTASEMRRRSHNEDAYKSAYVEGVQWRSIPYSLAETLSLTM